MKFKSTYKQETVYIDGEAIQFHNNEYTTEDKKLQTALAKVTGITKVEAKKAESPTV